MDNIFKTLIEVIELNKEEKLIRPLVEIIELKKDELDLYPQHIREINNYLQNNYTEDIEDYKDFELEIKIKNQNYSLNPSEIREIKSYINGISEIKKLENFVVNFNPGCFEGRSFSYLHIYLRGKIEEDFSVKTLIKNCIEDYLPSSGTTIIIIDIGEGNKEIFNDKIDNFNINIIDDL
jgi:hypothetical protein